MLNPIAGGRIFPGEHHVARFYVAHHGGHIDLAVESQDGSVSVKVVDDEWDALPATSCF